MNIAEMFENQSPPPKILLYGEVGSGKTVLALTLGEGTQVIDCDLGLRSGFSVKDEFTSARRAVDVKQFRETSLPRSAVAFAKCKETIFDIATQCNQNRYPYKAIILDSLTVFAEQAMNFILGNASKIGKNPEIQHWGMAFGEIKMVLGVLCSLPIPVVVIGHDQIKMVGETSKLELAISGKNMPAQVTRLFDEVWYMRASGGTKKKYTIQTDNNSVIVARSRSCIPNMTDTSIGMWKLLELMGYKKESKNNDLTSTTPQQTALKLTT